MCDPSGTGERGGAAGKMRINRGAAGEFHPLRTHVSVGRALGVAPKPPLLGFPPLRDEAGSG